MQQDPGASELGGLAAGKQGLKGKGCVAPKAVPDNFDAAPDVETTCPACTAAATHTALISTTPSCPHSHVRPWRAAQCHAAAP